MENIETTDLPKINVDKIISVGTPISSEEVLKDVEPIAWNDKVLNGEYAEKTIIKTSDIQTTKQKIYKK